MTLEREIWFRDNLPHLLPWVMNGRHALVLWNLLRVRYIKPEAA